MPNAAVILEQHDLFGATPQMIIPKIKKPVEERIAEAVKPDMVRVAPDHHGWIPKADTVPDMVLCRWVKQRNGEYVPIPTGGRWVRVCAKLCALLGFRDGETTRRHQTLFRLFRAGFVDMTQISPGVWLLDLDSWFRHIATCLDNPEMWEPDSEDRKTYLQKNGLGGWKRNEKKKRRRLSRAM